MHPWAINIEAGALNSRIIGQLASPLTPTYHMKQTSILPAPCILPGEMILSMLRRASLDIDVNRINMAGMTALHQVTTCLVSVYHELVVSRHLTIITTFLCVLVVCLMVSPGSAGQ